MTKNKHATSFFIILLFLYAYSGLIKWIPSGIDPTLVFGVLSLISIAFAFKRKIIVLKNELNVLIPMVLLLHLLILISALYTVSTEYYIIKLGKIFFNLIALLTPLVIITGKFGIVTLKKCCWAALIIGLLLLSYEFVNNNLQRIRFLLDADVSSSPLPDYMSISYFLGTMVLMLSDTKIRWKRSLLILAVMFMLLLAAKGPILFLIICMLFLYWKEIKFFRLRTLYFSLSSIIFIVGFSVATGSSLFSNIGGRLMFFSGGIEADQSSLERLILMGKAYEMIIENPFTGVGIGGFSMAMSGSDGRLSPHNIFFELWSEVGVLSVLLMIFIMIYSIIIYRKMIKKFPAKDGKSIVVICLYMFFGLLVGSYLEDLRLTYFWIGVSIAYFSVVIKESNKKLCVESVE